MTKRIIALLLAVVMVFSFAACGEKKEEPKQPEQKSALDGFPGQAFTMVVPVAAGAAVDIVARIIIDGLDLGAAINIENLAGAAQTVGTAEMASRAADGYTFEIIAPAGFISQPLMKKDLAYKTSDFSVLVGNVTAPSQTTVAVKKGSELADPDKFVEWLKSVDSFTYALPNVGGINQLALDQFLIALGVYDKGKAVVYTSSAETDAAILNGDVQFGCIDDDVMSKRLSGDQFDCVMTMTAEEDPMLPGFKYAGQYVDNFINCPGFKGIICRKDVPEEIKNYLSEKLIAWVKSDAYQGKLEAAGYPRMTEADFMEGEALQKYFDSYAQTAETVLKACGYID